MGKGKAISATTLPPGTSLFHRFLLCLRFSLHFVLSLSFLFSMVWLYISSWNYPGGEAMKRFHTVMRPHCDGILSDARVNNSSVPFRPLVHIHNIAAISGVSRFGEQPECYRYSKQEHLNPWELKSYPFDFLLAQTRSIEHFDSLVKPLPDGRDLSIIEAYSRDALAPSQWPMVNIQIEPALYLMRRTQPFQGQLKLSDSAQYDDPAPPSAAN